MKPIHGKSKRIQYARMGKKMDRWFIIVSTHYNLQPDHIQPFWSKVNDALNLHYKMDLAAFHEIAKEVVEENRRIVAP